MNRNDVKKSILEFIELIEKDSSADVESFLRLALDHVSLASHYVSYTFDDKQYSILPHGGHEITREVVSKKFPNLGYYNTVEVISEELIKTDVLVCDAIDDILDIYSDLKEVIWRWDHNSEDDALWYFNLSFTTHWGKHLRELQLYLHERVK